MDKMEDLLASIWITIMIFFTIVMSVLFDKFIESKPAGRKTVMGKLCRARTGNIKGCRKKTKVYSVSAISLLDSSETLTFCLYPHN